MATWNILLDILVLLTAALVLGTLAETVKQSAILGYLVAGTLVGPNVIGLVKGGGHVAGIAEIGVALLLFSIGLEFSFTRLRRLGRVALLGGSMQVVVTMGAATAVGLLFGLSGRAALAIGAMIALSSTACVLRLLVDRTVMETIYGRHTLGILLLQDLAVIPLMLLVALLAGGDTFGAAAIGLGRTVLLGGLLVGAFILLFHVIVPRVLNLRNWARHREFPILLAIVMAFGSAYAAHTVNLSPAMGAFVAGVLLGGSPFATQIRADVGSLKTLLVTLFFASIGMLGHPAWIAAHWPTVVAVVALVTVGKMVIVAGVVRGLGYAPGTAIATGLCLAQVGEFSFVLAETARAAGTLIGDDLFNLIVSSTIATLFLTPFFVAMAPRVGAWIEARRGDPPQIAAGAAHDASAGPRIVIVGFGPAGQSVAEALYGRYRDAIDVIELNPPTAATARRMGLRVHIGDATSRDVLEHVGLARAAVLAITIPDPAATRSIVHMARLVAPDTSIVARARYHSRRWEIEFAGAHVVVDEESHVGLRVAAMTRRFLNESARADPPKEAS
ncbi:MAG: cation:proton antiporter [Phycisphaerales bacterium]|nr:cation:proton antiporter [Phycisphaerales bacterium]